MRLPREGSPARRAFGAAVVRAVAACRAGGRDALALAGIVAVFVVGGGRYLVDCLSSEIPGGWDGVPHYAVAALYARRGFPALSGWIPEYFAGMPFPNLYPPLLYLVVAGLTRLGLGSAEAFFAVQLAASLLVPMLVYACARRLGLAPATACVAGLVCVGYMLDASPLTMNGITLHATFDVGLSSHVLGFDLVLAAYWAMLWAAERPPWRAPAILLLALVPLTNVHVVWNAIALLLPLVLVRLVDAPGGCARRRLAGVYACIGALALAIAACWLLPMLACLDYVPTRALAPEDPAAIRRAFIAPSVVVVSAGVVALRRRERALLALVLSQLLLAAAVFFPVTASTHLTNLSIQSARLAVPYVLFAGVLFAYLGACAAARWGRRAWWAIAALLAAFALTLTPVKRATGKVGATQMAGYAPVLEALRQHPEGRVLVETGTGSISDMFALQALVGQHGRQALTTVFREASTSVLFAAPLRNSFSKHGETFLGLDSKLPALGRDEEAVEATLARLRLFNVRSLALSSDVARARALRLPGARRISPPGPWVLYAYDAGEAAFAEVPACEPVLTFADYTVKRRPESGYDFVRLGEELFARGQLDVPLVLSRAASLDRERDLGLFRLALVTSYAYADLERAYRVLEAFSREHTLVLLSDPDNALFRRLRALAAQRPTLRVVERTPPAAILGRMQRMLRSAPQLSEGGARLLATRAAVRDDVGRLLDVLARTRLPVRDRPALAHVSLDGGVTEIRFARKPIQATPVWIKQTYFPNWTSDSGYPVFMATPTFQLTFVTEPALRLRFAPTNAERAGHWLSLLGLAVTVASAVWRGTRGGAAHS